MYSNRNLVFTALVWKFKYETDFRRDVFPNDILLTARVPEHKNPITIAIVIVKLWPYLPLNVDSY